MQTILRSMLLIMWLSAYAVEATIPVCLTNCVQCKQMFGRYFQGRACGEACISSNGRDMPDCNNPGTLGNYLKRLY
ncbi:PREDICTED: eclosion hormone-like [Nicrophorus vespilloides]|uniref:Eclosion hormone-like n=1 Tax=Nicrophorus vespilloides TaxID=110193 RepID=A0ABM1M902_NICVS|nr:PREDICTED: eclosion hormone-like [Nicrophorus vespilloides]